MQYAVETRSLVKRYGGKMAVDHMSIHVKPGDIYGLIGKNGAGKTSLMKLLLGLTVPNEGEMTLLGEKKPDRARRRIGSLVEAPALYRNETALENLKRFSVLSPTPEAEMKKILELVGLGQTGSKKAGSFSLGMRQRLGIAIALLGKPQLLILDEPINGLDPAGIREIRDVILELNAKGVTFLISSHLLDEPGKIETNYGIVVNGKHVEEITLFELEQKCRTSLMLSVDKPALAKEILGRFWDGISIEEQGGELRVSPIPQDSSEINRLLVEQGVRVYELKNESIGHEENTSTGNL